MLDPGPGDVGAQHQQAGQQLHTDDRRGLQWTNHRPHRGAGGNVGTRQWQSWSSQHLSRLRVHLPSLEESHDWPTFYNIQFPLCFSQLLFREDLCIIITRLLMKIFLTHLTADKNTQSIEPF